MIDESNIEQVMETIEKFIKEKTMIKKFVEEKFNPFQILFAAILSARTKDELSEKISRKIFEKVKEPEDLLKFSVAKLAKEIYPVGFYRIKAKNLIKLAKIIIEKHNGKVPEKMEELLELPGVGRKTANIVLSYAFNKPAIAVDTHVHRIFNRWGFVNTKTPEETEIELRKKLPKRLWKKVNNLLVNFGKTICRPIKPLCNNCPINQVCPFPEKSKNKIYS
jgi:endonuclease-3